jgi:hypothetical protein
LFSDRDSDFFGEPDADRGINSPDNAADAHRPEDTAGNISYRPAVATSPESGQYEPCYDKDGGSDPFFTLARDPEDVPEPGTWTMTIPPLVLLATMFRRRIFGDAKNRRRSAG